MPINPSDNPRPRRVRAGTSRARGGFSGRGNGDATGRAGAVNGGGNGGGPQAGAEGLAPADRRRLRRDLLLGRTRKAPRRRRPGLRVALLILALLSTAGAGLAATVFAGYNVYLGQIPDAATVASMEPPIDTNIYAADGTLIDVIHPSGSFHLHAAYDQISSYLVQATVDTEDRHYWTEQSLDLPRIAQAGWGYLRKVNEGGASTIPEQLAKLSFLQDDGSLSYKIKEIILGSELDQDFNKQQILEMYLNRIPYGNQSIGIETAAQIYFHEPASKLDLAQSAMLAGLPKAPSEFDPLTNPTAAKQRQEAVLQSMVANCSTVCPAGHGDITQAQADAATAEKLTFYGWWQYEPPTVIDGANTSSFLDYLENFYLPELFQGDTFKDPGGYDIYTTLNLKDQALADATVHDVITANANRWFEQPSGADGALVSLDPQTGAVLAMTGSANYQSPVYKDDNMAIAGRQPGSTMKLFTYTDLIASRQYTVTTQISDESLTLNGWTPKDYEGATSGLGYCELEYCLGNSLNIPAVRAEYAEGVLPVANLAVDMGVTLLQGSNFPAASTYSFTLGTSEVSPLDLADGAATVADLGIQHNPAPVTKVTLASDGTPVYQYNAAAYAHRVVPENVAYIIDETLSQDKYRQPEFGLNDKLNLPGRPVAAKTGTSGSGYASYENFTVGWTPNVLTTVWVGDPNGESAAYGLRPGVTSGLTGAAPIWQTYMEGVTANTPVEWYTQPSDVYEAGGSYYLPGTGPDSSMGSGGPICNPNCAGPPSETGVPFSEPYTAPPPPTPTPTPTPGPTPAPGLLPPQNPGPGQ